MIEVQVVESSEVADGVRAVVLSRPDGAPLPHWEPGAHIELHLPSGLVRQYSLSSSPADAHRWRLGVLRERNSRGGSAWVHDSAAVGSIVQVSLPRNQFRLRDAPSYRFIAGGIGITPLLPMIAEVAASGAEWRLLYGGRTRASMAFLGELSAFGDNVLVRPQDEYGLLDLASFLSTPRPDEQVYACGPDPLLGAIETAMAGWPTDSLRVERFVPIEVDASGDVSFDVEFVESGLAATVEPGQTLLEVAYGLGIGPDSSCREGTCGTCETIIIEGDVEHRDTVLSAAERETNESMMICVSRAARGCPLLKLEL